MLTISRKQAKELNLKRYFTGIPCKNGHISERVISGDCIMCNTTRYSSFSNSNKDRLKSKQKAYREVHKAKRKIVSKAYNKLYKIRNRPTFNFYNSMRRTRKLNATPKWANLGKIREIYEGCPKGKTVDHIIPLKGVNEDNIHIVCGLHVESNLQYLTPSENSTKTNKYLI